MYRIVRPLWDTCSCTGTFYEIPVVIRVCTTLYMPVLGALSPFLEPFYGHLSPKVDETFQKWLLTEGTKGLAWPCTVWWHRNTPANLSGTMYLFIRKSTFPQNSQLDILIRNCEQVDDFGGDFFKPFNQCILGDENVDGDPSPLRVHSMRKR